MESATAPIQAIVSQVRPGQDALVAKQEIANSERCTLLNDARMGFERHMIKISHLLARVIHCENTEWESISDEGEARCKQMQRRDVYCSARVLNILVQQSRKDDYLDIEQRTEIELNWIVEDVRFVVVAVRTSQIEETLVEPDCPVRFGGVWGPEAVMYIARLT